MGSKKEYRTSIRSKRWIREAFTQLLQEKEYAKITVTDIAERADINRSTFYKHYPDVRGLMESIEDEVCAEMFHLLEGFDYDAFFEDPAPVLEELCDFLEADRGFYRILLSSSESRAFLDKLKLMFEQYMLTSENIPSGLRSSPSFQIRIVFFAGGTTNLLEKWITGQLVCSREDIVREIRFLLKDGPITVAQ